MEDRTRELSALSNHLQALSEREKSELARKLHDELGGLLTAAKMDLSWLQSRLEGAPIQERLAQLGSVLDEAMDLKRRVVEELRPSLLDHFGLPTALRTYVESTCAKAGLASQIVIEHTCESMPKDTTIALFRVVQEGLSNIIRHAQAKTVKLELSGDDSHCSVTLSDDGRGFDALSSQFRWSHGLMGMRQRAEALGGRLDIESRIGGGTRVRVEIPSSRQ
ncbi:MAG: ATPase [Gammaproteobacteria bacterium]|nr:ATPase [Gammaproteobacteria bacterium]